MLPVVFSRREQLPDNLLFAKEDRHRAMMFDSEKGGWSIGIDCWAPFPARTRTLDKRGAFEINTMMVGAEDAVILKVVVPAKAFEVGECKIQAFLFEDGRQIAASRLLHLKCGAEGQKRPRP
jgi:hypothetical protein